MRKELGQNPLFLVAFAAAFSIATPLHAQTEQARTLELSGGGSVSYTLRTYPADAHLARPKGELAPTSALDAAKLLNLYLSTGDIEEAALLSNAPRRRFEVLRDYRESIGEEAQSAIAETGHTGHVAQEFIPAKPDVLASLRQAVGICTV